MKLFGTTPARVNAEQAGWLLGFAIHDIPVLVKAGLLKPLGHPSQNSTKYYATVELEKLRQDERWLSRATNATSKHWQAMNAVRKKPILEKLDSFQSKPSLTA